MVNEARKFMGTADTVGDLITILQQLPSDAQVRVPTMSHTFRPDVYDQGEQFGTRYVTLEP